MVKEQEAERSGIRLKNFEMKKKNATGYSDRLRMRTKKTHAKGA